MLRPTPLNMYSVAEPIGAALVVVFLFTYVRSLLAWRARSRGVPLPPGPKRLPFFGNMFNMPASQAWIAHRDLSAVYGEQPATCIVYGSY